MKTTTRFRFFTSLLVVTIVAGVLLCFLNVLGIHSRAAVPQENVQLIAELKSGYNLGNDLDVCDWNSKYSNKYGTGTETIWGGAPVTKDFIKKLADDGFGVVRVPVTYMNHIDYNGNVDPAWLARVHEVTGWVIESGMYCIVDIHHDTGNDGWIKATSDNYSSNSAKVSNMISQIAKSLNDFDDHLILESFNEMVDNEKHWKDVPQPSLDAYNSWNQLFVDTVRATGGNNSRRYLLINTYAASTDARNINEFKMPRDNATNRLIAGVHNYSKPDALEASFDRVKKLSDKGYPVIVGEFGAKANASFDRAEYARRFVELSRQYGFCPIWWDNNENPQKKSTSSFSIYNRKGSTVYYEDIVRALTGR